MILDVVLRGLSWSAGISAVIAIVIMFVNVQRSSALVSAVCETRPHFAENIRSLIWTSVITLSSLSLITAAHIARLVLVRPLFNPYPTVAYAIDFIGFLVLITALLTPSWLLYWRRRKAEDTENARSS